VSEDVSVERLPVAQAAEVLGVTRDAIHKRIQRGTIDYEKGDDGRFYVFVDTSTQWLHSSKDTSTDTSTDESRVESGALISEMRGRIEDLRAQLEAERQAHAEARRLLLSALEKIPPAIEAPSEPPESPTAATPQPGRVEPQAPLEEAQEAPEMHMPEAGGGPLPRDRQTPSERPWWRRMFGG
jgi:hypothetical protein